MYLNLSSGILSIICKSEKLSIFAIVGRFTAKKVIDSLIVYFRIQKERIITYTHLGIESTKFLLVCIGQNILNTVLQSRLKKSLGFSTEQHSFSIFSGALGVRKNYIYSTEIITKKNPKKITIFL